MTYRIRSAQEEDITLLCAHRRQMFIDMGYVIDEKLELMSTHFAEWVKGRLQIQTYYAWLAVHQDVVVAGAGLWLMDWPPHILDPHGPRSYILNVYTEKAHRRQGLVRQLIECCLQFAQERQIKVVVLHASEHGKALYESLGFRSANEMRLTL